MATNTKYDDASRQEDRRNAYIGTASFFGLLLLACLFLGLTTPLPIPEEMGATVMLGETEFGNDFSSPIPINNPQPNNPQPERQVDPVENTDPVVTNDASEEPVVATETDPIDKPVEPEQTETTTEDNTETTTTEPEPTPRTSNTNFEFTKSDNKNSGKGTGADEGNQGSKNGDPNSRRPGLGKDGYAIDGLKGRGLVKGPPAITGENQSIQKIVIEITVNRNGEVIRAVPTIKGGGTITTGALVEEAKAAVLKMRFTSNPDAFEEQTGTVTFNVKPR